MDVRKNVTRGYMLGLVINVGLMTKARGSKS